MCSLSATLKPAEWRSRGDDPPTEKVALIAQGTCPKSSFCHTRVHSNHPSVAPVSPCTPFSAKQEGENKGTVEACLMLRFNFKRQYMKKMTHLLDISGLLGNKQSRMRP